MLPPDPPWSTQGSEAAADGFKSPDEQHRFILQHGSAERLLGEGAYKKVWLAYDSLEGREVAWNVVNVRNLPKREKQRIVSEIRLLKDLGKNDHIIEFISTWTNRERGEVIFITEMMNSGSLKDFIMRVQLIRYKVIKKWCANILQGLHFLHSHDPPIIHRDLKCDNLFYDGQRRGGKIVIGDMGLSTYVLGSAKQGSVLGTPQFMAPELYEDKGYDEKIDIYAFGMCVLEIVSKRPPYDGLNVAQIYRRVTAGDMPPMLARVKNAVCRDFIRVCLVAPEDRPSAEQLMQHEFMVTQKMQDESQGTDNPLVMVVPDEEVAELEGADGDDEGMSSLPAAAAAAAAPAASVASTHSDTDWGEIQQEEGMESRIDHNLDDENEDDDDDDAQIGTTHDWDDSEERKVPGTAGKVLPSDYEAVKEQQEKFEKSRRAQRAAVDAAPAAAAAAPPLVEVPVDPRPSGSPSHGRETSIITMQLDSETGSVLGETTEIVNITLHIQQPGRPTGETFELEFSMDPASDTIYQVAVEMQDALRELSNSGEVAEGHMAYSLDELQATIMRCIEGQTDPMRLGERSYG